MKNALIVLSSAFVQFVDTCLHEIVRDLTEGESPSLPPRDVPDSGWSSDAGDRRVKRIVACVLFGSVVVLVIAQMRHHFQR